MLAAPAPEERREDERRVTGESGPAGKFDVMILDFDSASSGSQQWSTLPKDGAAQDGGAPVVLMANDESRLQALDLVERGGAYGYVRKPPVVREVRAILRSACERRLQHRP